MKKKVMIIILVLLLIMVVMGVTYAFFATNYISNIIETKSGKIDVEYISNSEISGKLLPTDDYLNGLYTMSTINLNESSLDSVATIKLNIEEISPFLQNDSLNWILIINDEIINQGNFLDISTGDVINLYDNYKLKNDITTLKLYVWLDEKKASNETMNQTFIANLYVETHQITATE